MVSVRPFFVAGTVAPGDVFVLAHSSADAAILAHADQTNGAGWFDGDDAVVLTKGPADEVIDVIGQVGLDPGAEWDTNLAPAAEIGNHVRVIGTVSEFRPGADPDNLTITQINSLERERDDALDRE